MLRVPNSVLHCKRLIEGGLPVKRISRHAAAEKESRASHIPRLHIYPAARPQAACRAVLLAALLPDPVDLANLDSPAVQTFLHSARDDMRGWALEMMNKVSADSFTRFERIRREPAALTDVQDLRTSFFDFIADFADPSNATDPAYIEMARRLVGRSNVLFGAGDAAARSLLDPFCGGGAIPVEGARLGLDVYASDLNPVAVLINKVLLEYLPRHGDHLVNQLDKFLSWASPRARTALAEFFYAKPHETPVAYLWARTILSDAPGGEFPVEVPLLRSMRLTRGRRGGDWCLRWVRDGRSHVKTDRAHNSILGKDVLRPQLEIIRTTGQKFEEGTSKGGAATCPVTGHTTPVREVRRQLSSRDGGTADARLYCVVVDKNDSRSFREPTEKDIEAIEASVRRVAELKRASSYDDRIPVELLPPEGTNGFRVQKYGLRRWADLFTPRQLLCHITYSRLITDYCDSLRRDDPSLAEALQATLGLLIDRLADLNASLCVWQLNTPNTAHVFGRWALPMIFDFGEINPLAGAGGSPESALGRITACLREMSSIRSFNASVYQSDAGINVLPDDSAAVLFTDPPYYDAIPYSDLLDFFCVWLSRALPSTLSHLFENGLSPKLEECVVDASKGKDHDFFARKMTMSLDEARRVLISNGIGIVVFAHKSTSAWEAQLDALLKAGWKVTASWPLDTEMTSRLRAKNSAALSSSVHLVCRPRGRGDGAAIDEGVGNWRDVLQELPQRIHDWMPRLAREGIVGADAIFACLGPALELFSRFSRVEKASGETVPLREYLEQVWAAVSREAISVIFESADTSGLDPDARLTAMWLWTLAAPITAGGDESEAGESEATDDETGSSTPARTLGFVLEFDAARKIAQGLGADLSELSHVVEIKGDTGRLLSVAERSAHLFGTKPVSIAGGSTRRKQLALFEEIVAEAELASWGDLGGPKAGATTLDRVHQAMLLFGTGRVAALKGFLMEVGVGRQTSFWKLAQALAALYPTGTDEKRWVDGVLARKKALGFA